MKKLMFVLVVLSALGLLLGVAFAAEQMGGSSSSMMNEGAGGTMDPSMMNEGAGGTMAPSMMRPTDGWALHIDAKLHIPGMPDMVAHHYCKPVMGGLTQCQLYDSDRFDARLIGVEVIVGPEMFAKFNKEEKARWHYHKVEIPLVDAKLPDMSAEEAAKVVKSMEESYGKVYILWNPAENELPVGEPAVSILPH